MAAFSRAAFLGFSLAVILSPAIPRPALAATPPPRPVRVIAVALTPQQESVTYSGTIQARVQADLAFRVGGKIIERPVNLGEVVKAGDLLARLDPSDLRFSLEAAAQSVAAAEADAVNARAEFARYQRLGSNSPAYLPSEFDKRQATLDGAEARAAQARRQLALAQDQLAYTELRADADGFVAALPMQVGQVVQPGQTVATLAHSKEIEAVVDVPENRLPEIRAASEIAISLWSDPSHTLHGRVREIGALADPASRTFTVRVTVPDPPAGGWALGMTATVRFAHQAGAPVALLPASALADRDGKPAVWVLDPADGRASLRPVVIAAYEGNGVVAISAGLAPGEQVVTAGVAGLRPDMEVTAWSGAQH